MAGCRRPARRALLRSTLLGVGLAVGVAGCAALRREPAPPPVEAPPPPAATRSAVVTATAYNSTPDETEGDPRDTAHGVRLRPGMRVIAVSRDLEARGLGEGTEVEIEGLPGVWRVADRMPEQHTNKIDVYMGDDVERAKQFGKRRVTIRWRPESGSAAGGM